ncbi:diacylglycerol kinase family protein [Actinocatenispora sera]|uniref:diacylglycerol/lipid kinase family protein n=1 Tax=Actinocatenispora sera TaxID=390989 RepID=UPI001FD62810|nr:diacylglycerol kinase family protein [Actinocatenispora sera]
MNDGAEVAVLVNPTAGRGRRGGVLADVVGRLRAARLVPRVLAAPDRERAQQACRDAVDRSPAALVAVGGDGTVHLAVQAVAGTDVPLGVVPIGTGNDFVGALGLPLEPEAAIKALVAALTQGQRTVIDLGRATGPGADPLWFGTVLSAGLDASINERANQLRWPKGPRRYDLSILAEIAQLAPHDYKLVLDGETRELTAMIVAVGNTARYGGGLPVCPTADPTDGVLDLTIIGPIGRATAVKMKSLMRKAKHVEHPAVSTHRVRTLEIHGEPRRTYADGERGLPLPVTVECVPGSLQLLA